MLTARGGRRAGGTKGPARPAPCGVTRAGSGGPTSGCRGPYASGPRRGAVRRACATPRASGACSSLSRRGRRQQRRRLADVGAKALVLEVLLGVALALLLDG